MTLANWEVLVAATGSINKVASRFDALQAIANTEKCDVRDLNVEDRSSSMSTDQRYAVDLRGRHVGEFWPCNRLEELRRFALANNEVAFANLCTRALLGVPWAIERTASAEATLDAGGAYTLLAIRHIDCEPPAPDSV